MTRRLTDEERELIVTLIGDGPDSKYLIQSLDHAIVIELGDDRGIRFIDDKHKDRKLGRQIADVGWIDLDGVPVRVWLDLDNYNNLYELELWKVDDSPLLKFPSFG